MDCSQVNNSKKQQRKTIPQHFSIDYGKLEADLQKQIQEDELYWLRNDAKIRAVTQGTTTYEDFRQIVLAAHLKPLSKEEKEDLQKKSSTGNVVWNTMAAGKEANTGTCSESARSGAGDAFKTDLNSPAHDLPIPITTTEFTKTWKSLKNNELRWRFLKSLLCIDASRNTNTQDVRGRRQIIATTTQEVAGENSSSEKMQIIPEKNVLQRLCADEVPPEICSELITCLLQVVTIAADKGEGNEGTRSLDVNEEWRDVVHILYIISQSKRHRLSLSMLSEKDTKNLDAVMNAVRGRLSNSCKTEVEAMKTELQGEAKILLDLFHITESRIFPANHQISRIGSPMF